MGPEVGLYALHLVHTLRERYWIDAHALGGAAAVEEEAVNRMGPRFPCECISGQQFHGQCCTNCQHHVRLMSHPWHNGLEIDYQMGWVCMALYIMHEVEKCKGESRVSFAGLHGMCECWMDGGYLHRLDGTSEGGKR